ncbi:type II secretion system protein [Acetobacterium wieringae]|uniref:type II secretion system protein n=1 Tax=Acetobacterium wieringae TaxID=52694 RepID=UPI0026EDB080|nr:type II secretion system protein [Acetobacterium wieringae]
MELINKIRKSRKGFTLVEIIVVLVILAILAAFTIPAMLGFVNDAKGKAYIAEAREVYVAAQATATEMIADGSLNDGDLTADLDSTSVKASSAPTASSTADNNASYQMKKYLDVSLGGDITISADDVATVPTVATLGGTESAWTVTVGTGAASTAKTGKIETLIYYKNGYIVTIKDDKSTVSKMS